MNIVMQVKDNQFIRSKFSLRSTPLVDVMSHISIDIFIEEISSVNSHLSSGQEAKCQIKKHSLSPKLYLVRGY